MASKLTAIDVYSGVYNGNIDNRVADYEIFLLLANIWSYYLSALFVKNPG